MNSCSTFSVAFPTQEELLPSWAANQQINPRGLSQSSLTYQKHSTAGYFLPSGFLRLGSSLPHACYCFLLPTPQPSFPTGPHILSIFHDYYLKPLTSTPSPLYHPSPGPTVSCQSYCNDLRVILQFMLLSFQSLLHISGSKALVLPLPFSGPKFSSEENSNSLI